MLSRKPIGTALTSLCQKAGTDKTGYEAGTDKTGLDLILMIYTCLQHNTQFYAFIGRILTFVRFSFFLQLENGISF